MNKYQAPSEFIGRQTIFLESCESTNSLALAACTENTAEEGLVIIAEHQTKGRGQMGNRWDSKIGENLLFSIVLKPSISAAEQFFLSKSVACGIIEGISNWAKLNFGRSLPLSIKWPNDLYINEKKLGGILIENQWNSGKWTHSVVGIGLNINQTSFEGLRATSLKEQLGSSESLEKPDLFNSICLGIEKYYKLCEERHFERIDDTYHSYLFRLNEWHLYQDQSTQEIFDGKILRVNEQGLVIIEKQNGYKMYDLKEIIFIFPT